MLARADMWKSSAARNRLGFPVRSRSSRFCRCTYGIHDAVSLNRMAMKNGCANAPVNVPNATERDAIVTVNPIAAAKAIAPATAIKGIEISAAVGHEADTSGAPTTAQTSAATAAKLKTPASVSAMMREDIAAIFTSTRRKRLVRTSSHGHVAY